MAVDFPVPKVPALQQPGNYIDLDQLGGLDLLTYIYYPGIAEGSFFSLNWRGCGAVGEVVDIFGDLIEVINLEPDGMPVMIDNQKLERLDQGWVFYSYYVPDRDNPDTPFESNRLFFNVGRPSIRATPLAVPQCKQSHDLKLDPELLRSGDITFVTPPYKAMRAGDKVTLTLERYFGVGDPWEPLNRTHTVTASEAGQPLTWNIAANELSAIEGGYALMSQKIAYADTTVTTLGPVQTLDIVAPDVSLLPRLEIKDFNGGSLDPQSFPDGITLKIEAYKGMQVSDEVVVYVSSDSRLVKTLRTDVSTIDSQVLEFKVDQDWLVSNNGKTVDFMYQYARQGTAGSSIARSVMLRQPLDLPVPDIKHATVDEASEGGVIGCISALALQAGVEVRIPASAVIGPDDTVQMHWDGYGSTGSFIADPSISDPKLFIIPAKAVPANMGKRIDVYYQVTPLSEPPGTSKVFDLEVKGINSGWPVIQNVLPSLNDGLLALGAVPAEGAGLQLASWMYMDVGQRVRIIVTGLSSNGGPQSCNVRTGAAEPVTDAEYKACKVSGLIPKAFLEGLQLETETINVKTEVSFDEGATYVPFSVISFSLTNQMRAL
ncbi:MULTISPECIES: hypothetical protein [Pseudomonas syringae group]|uniref:Uncharacterized protein n=4 Tax=Pseudomonas syringae group TaxID=136849 RepID=A0AAD0E1X7_9PSED|nr:MULTISPECIES: hypothetical protein [Pseudomonas syringae group]AVB20918.1 hypothetical protein BKM03_18100 [Pseudomonas avellanae]EGH09794.1 hypothetical protein PSYMP_10892 [Pseudomonas amygdali pv. morsprunorum str. M302280]KWS71136.1 hypothetical protein AL055_13895 [Pseudomonas amygdali pv. morsprunorum]PHN49332.1 hypothetical protein AO261_27125 [Pseudomonas avellanae]POC93546.1 hypothetical protein BKM26_12015 [Pseudomonas avellanae]